MKLFAFILLLSIIGEAQSDRCDTQAHPQYGRGTCMPKDDCSGTSIQNWCESKPGNIRCCFPRSQPQETPRETPRRDRCETQVHQQHGQGTCMAASQCRGITVDNWCESKPSNVKCCFPSTTPRDAAPATRRDRCETQVHQQHGQGACMAASQCRGVTVDNWCESKPSNVKCCFPSTAPRETPRETRGDRCETQVHQQHGQGTCMAASQCRGITVDNWCESKPSNVKCCFPSSAPRATATATRRDRCETQVHQEHGKGTCMATSQCRGITVDSWCESKPSNVKCCFPSSASRATAPTTRRDRCEAQEHPQHGQGTCMAASQCRGITVDSWCESKPSNVKCCFPSATPRGARNTPAPATGGEEEPRVGADPCETTGAPFKGKGQCIPTRECPRGDFRFNLCPSHPRGVTCCFSKGAAGSESDTDGRDGPRASRRPNAPNLPGIGGERTESPSSTTETMSHDDAAEELSALSIPIRSSRNCSDRRRLGCTSLEQVRRDTICFIKKFKEECGCSFAITGGTETGHSTRGQRSHEKGYKLDISRNAKVDSYIKNNFHQKGERWNKGKQEPVYEDGNANEFALESDHWDITAMLC